MALELDIKASGAPGARVTRGRQLETTAGRSDGSAHSIALVPSKSSERFASDDESVEPLDEGRWLYERTAKFPINGWHVFAQLLLPLS